MLETIQDQKVAIDTKLEQQMKETEETQHVWSSDSDRNQRIRENVAIDETSKEHCLSENGEDHSGKRDVAVEAHLDESREKVNTNTQTWDPDRYETLKKQRLYQDVLGA